MTAESLRFRSQPLIGRLGALVGIVVVASAVAIGFGWAVSTAYHSYVAYINRPPFYTYTSKLGAISFTYPSSMNLEVNTYGIDHIESAYLRRTYNASEVTDSELIKYKGSFRVSTTNFEGRYSGIYNIDDAMARKVKSFREIYFYEDPRSPNRLESVQKHSDIIRVHDTREIGGRVAEYYRVEEKRHHDGDYNKRIFIMIPAGELLYEIEGQTSSYSWDENVSDPAYLDRIVDSIKIGDSK